MSTALPGTLDALALRRLRSATYALVLSVAPAVAALTGLAIRGQRLSIAQWAGIALVMVASAAAVAGAEPPDVPAPKPLPADAAATRAGVYVLAAPQLRQNRSPSSANLSPQLVQKGLWEGCAGSDLHGGLTHRLDRFMDNRSVRHDQRVRHDREFGLPAVPLPALPAGSSRSTPLEASSIRETGIPTGSYLRGVDRNDAYTSPLMPHSTTSTASDWKLASPVVPQRRPSGRTTAHVVRRPRRRQPPHKQLQHAA